MPLINVLVPVPTVFPPQLLPGLIIPVKVAFVVLHDGLQLALASGGMRSLHPSEPKI